MKYDAPKAFKILSTILTSTGGTAPTQKAGFRGENPALRVAETVSGNL
jgi:hypothetical protein